MKIRVTGTASECALAQEFYMKLASSDDKVKSCSVSKPYLNRGSVNQYRVYVDIEYYSDQVPGNKQIQSP